MPDTDHINVWWGKG